MSSFPLEQMIAAFWQGRRTLNVDPAASHEAFTRAAAAAVTTGVPEAVTLIEAAILELERQFDQACTILEPLYNDEESPLQGHIHYLLGSIYADLKLYARAQLFIMQAPDYPDFNDTRSYALLLLGHVETSLQHFDNAINYYLLALKDDNFSWRGHAWYYIGLAQLKKNEPLRAKDSLLRALIAPFPEEIGNIRFRLALIALTHEREWELARAWLTATHTDPHFKKKGDVYFCMGYAYHQEGNLTQALSYYMRALRQASLTDKASTLLNIGMIHLRQGDVPAAVSSWKRTRKYLIVQHDEETARLVASIITAAGKPPDTRDAGDEKLLHLPPQWGEWQISAEQPMILKIRDAEQTEYLKYAGQKDSGLTDVLAVLKGWGSAVPVVMGGDVGCRGGGYLLKWRGYGLIIDPGYDFLRNFREYGFHGSEFNVVVVTHDHPDHNQDWKALDDLRYELLNAELRAHPAERENICNRWAYRLVVDEDTMTNHGISADEKIHRTKTTTFLGAHHDWSGLTQTISLDPLPFMIAYFRTEHSGLKNAVGLRITCLNADNTPGFILGYTSDTEYLDTLSKDGVLKGCHVLIAHVSQPTVEELIDPNTSKPGHLGYRGVERLIDECDPPLTVVCEFWAGIADLRIELVKALRLRCKRDTIIPGGIGLRIDPRTRRIYCTNCGDTFNLKQISVTAPDHQFSPLGYLCDRCRLNGSV